MKKLRNQQKELTETDHKILKHIAHKGPLTEYTICHKDHIGSSSTVFYSNKKLKNLGLIEVKKDLTEQFSKIPSISINYLGLTFRGFHYCIYKKLVDTKTASSLFSLHKISLPSLPRPAKSNHSLDNMIKTLNYTELPKITKEYFEMFPLQFLNTLQNFYCETLDQTFYNGTVYDMILTNLAFLALNNPEQIQQILSEGSYIKKYFKKTAKDIEPALKMVGGFTG